MPWLNNENASRAWRVLLVEDDEDDYILTRQMLKDSRGASFSLDWACSYAAGLDKLAKCDYDAVLVDYDLGAHSGIEFIEAVIARGCTIPLILYTGRGSYDVDVEAMRAGATLYLTKAEANSLLLERAIRYAIERKQAEEALRKANEQEQRINQELNHELAERKRMEIARQAARDAQHASEERLQLVLSGARAAAWEWDFVSGRGTWSPEMYQLLGLDPASLPLDPEELARFIDPQDRDFFLAELYTASSSGSTYHFDCCYYRPDGSQIWLSWSGRAELDKAGRRWRISGIARDITDRKQMETALRETQSELLGFFNASAVYMFVVELAEDDFIFTLPNQKTASYFGLSVESLTGASARSLGFSELAMNHWLRVLKMCQQWQRPISLEFSLSYRHRKGWYYGTVSPIPTGQSGRPRFALAGVDITARKRMDLELRENRQQMAQMLESIHDGFFAFDRQWRYTYINQKASEPLGFKPEELIGKNLWEQFPRMVGSKAEAHYRQAMDHGIASQYRVLGVYSGRWYDVNVYPSTEGISVFIVDRTEQVFAEQALKQSEERFRLALSNLPDIFFIYDSERRYEFVNSNALERSQRLLSDYIGKRDEEIWPEAMVKKYLPYLELVYQTKEKQRFNYFATRADGSAIAQTITYVPLLDEHGDVQQVLAIAQDISERIESENKLRAFAGQLQASNQSLEEFAFVASHDLKEPLRKIQAFSDQILEKEGEILSSEGRDSLNRMHKAAHRMLRMIDGLLEYSRMSPGSELNWQPVDLGKVVSEVIADLEELIRECDGKVEAGLLPVVEADELQIYRLFQNLITNAIKFHRPGEAPLVRVSYQPAPTSGSIEIHVCDNGIGFEPERAEQIFRPFSRLRSAMEVEGNGIGLAVCKRIVVQHGGSIAAFSNPGQGSEFVVTLPVKHARPEHDQ